MRLSQTGWWLVAGGRWPVGWAKLADHFTPHARAQPMPWLSRTREVGWTGGHSQGAGRGPLAWRGSVGSRRRLDPNSIHCGDPFDTTLVAGLALRVHGHSGSRLGRHLYVILLTPKGVADIPKPGFGLVGNGFAALHVLRGCRRCVAIATNLGADSSPGDRAADGSEIFAASSADLVTQNAANEGSSNCSRYVGTALILRHLFAFNPASLFRCVQNSAHGSDGCFIEAFVVASTVLRGGHGRIRVNIAYRRRTVVQPHRCKRWVASGSQRRRIGR